MPQKSTDPPVAVVTRITAGPAFLLIVALCPALCAAELPDIRTAPPDLEVPALTDGDPAPGRRVKQVAPQYEGTDVHHVLYLPEDWEPDARYPVIVEYAGNGPYRSPFGDVSTGQP